MLIGSLVYRDLSTPDYQGTNNVYTLNVKAAEFVNTIWLHISSPSDISLMKQIKINKELYYRIINPDKFNEDIAHELPMSCRVDVGKSISTNATNTVFAARVGTPIRYTLGVSNRELVNEYGRAIAKDQIQDTTFEVEYDCSIPKRLCIHTKYIDLVLNETTECEVFGKLKKKDNFGNILYRTPISTISAKYNSATLGVEVPKIDNDDIPAWGMYENIEDVIAANPNKNTKWILDRHYIIVNKDNVDEILAKFKNYNGLIAFDTETTGLRVNWQSMQGKGDTIVGFSLSYKAGQGYYFPLAHKKFDNLTDDITDFMLTKVKPILEGKRIICHNTSFDWKVAYLYGINVNVVYDTMVAFSCTYRYMYGKTYKTGLKELAKNILGLDMFDLNDFVIGEWGNQVTFADLPYELVRRYATADADMTLSLYDWLEKNQILKKFGAIRVHDLEVQFAKVVGYSEFYGYRIDLKNLPEMIKRTEEALELHHKNMEQMLGHSLNPNSPQQLAAAMYDELKIQPTKKDSRSTDKDTLRELSYITDEDGNTKYPFVTELQAYRSHAGTYKNFIKKKDEFVTEDGYVYPNVYQFGTDTGRVSIKEPNYQSYDGLVKHYVIPRDGYLMFDCDYSQIEYRVLASMAGQTNLCEAMNDPDTDYHTHQASRMFGVPYASVSSGLRKQAKSVNFALPYGMGDRSLGGRIFGKITDENTRKAAALRAKYFEGQEKILHLFEGVRAQGAKTNYTSTWLGRRRYYDRQRFSVADIRRQAGNHVIQGTAADIYKMGVVKVFDMIVKNDWLGKVLINAFVHDELVIEIHNSINPYEFLKYWRDEYQVKLKNFCTLYAGAGFGHNWYEAKSQDLPPQFIQQCIDRADKIQWNGDIAQFIEQCKKEYFNYKVQRVADYITDKNNDNAVIKPIINSLLLEVTSKKLGLSEKELTKKYSAFDDIIKQFVQSYSDRFVSDSKVYKILSPDMLVVAKVPEKVDGVQLPQVSRLQNLLQTCLMTGIVVDTETQIVYVKYVANQEYLNLIKSKLILPTDRPDDSYTLYFVAMEPEKKLIKPLKTEFGISGADCIYLQNLLYKV